MAARSRAAISDGWGTFANHRRIEMFICCIPASVRKSIVSAVASASVASAVLFPGDAAAAKMSACQVRHSYCTERCIMNYDGGRIDACIHRTCDKQNPGCGPGSLKGAGGKGGGKLTLPWGSQPTRAPGALSPVGAGLLDTSPGFPAQAPAATGTLRAPAPSAPPVIIR